MNKTYIYQEYPKAVKDKDGNEVVVNGVDEEAKAVGKSEAVVQKQVDANVQDGTEAQESADERKLKDLQDKGTDVSEDEIAEITDLAAKVEASKKRGRPSKADIAAREGK